MQYGIVLFNRNYVQVNAIYKRKVVSSEGLIPQLLAFTIGCACIVEVPVPEYREE
jgi:hypothetical protein